MPLILRRDHQRTSSGEVEQLICQTHLVLQEMCPPHVAHQRVWLIASTGRDEPGLLAGNQVRQHGLMKTDQFGDTGRNCRQFIRPDVLGDQDGEPNDQLGAKGLAYQYVVVHPVKDPLRVELRVLGIADMEDLFPGNEYIVEDGRRFEFVALRCQRMFRGIAFYRAFTAKYGYTGCVVGNRGEDDLLARDAGPKQTTDMHIIAERDTRSDRLDAVDDDTRVGFLDDAKVRRTSLGLGTRTIRLGIDEIERAIQVLLAEEFQEVSNVLREVPALCADRLSFPHCGVVGISS